MKRHKEFTLIELLIVVALILIIAAITIPSLTQSTISANETSAMVSIRAIAEIGLCQPNVALLARTGLVRVTSVVISLTDCDAHFITP